MKKFIIYLFLSFIVLSCCEYTKSNLIKIKTKIIYRKYIPQHDDYEYHYGYDMLKCKYCYHYGRHTIDEKYTMLYIIENDTLETNDKIFYMKDSLNIEYIKFYCDSVFKYHNIIKIY